MKLLGIGKLSNREIYTLINVVGICGLGLILMHVLGNVASDVILWITAYVVALYTVETSDLKRINEAQLYNQQAPIISVQHGFMQGESMHLQLYNSGNGLAKDVEVYIQNMRVYHGATLQPVISMYNHVNTQRPSINGDKLTELLEERQASLPLRVHYRSVNGKKYATLDLTWYLDTADPGTPRYNLDVSKWTYKELD